MVHKGAVKLEYVPTDKQVEDVLTRPLSKVKIEYFKDKLGVVQKDFPSREGVMCFPVVGSDFFPSSWK
jgi:hypothetical protein